MFGEDRNRDLIAAVTTVKLRGPEAMSAHRAFFFVRESFRKDSVMTSAFQGRRTSARNAVARQSGDVFVDMSQVNRRRTRSVRHAGAVVLVALMFAVSASGASAQSGSGTDQGAQTPTQAPRPQTAREQPALPPVVAGQDGFAMQSANGDFRLQVGLLVHADGRFGIDDSDQQVVDTFAFRRLRPYLRGRFSRRFEFYFNPDFAGGTLVVQDAYVDTVFTPGFRVRAGKGKTPFGMERLHSASNLLFFNRAMPTALAPNRDLGIQILGDISGGVVSYLAGVMNGVSDGGSADVDTADGKDVSGRVVVRPFNTMASSPLKGLGVAISGSNGRQAGAAALPTFRTQSLEVPYFSYSGAAADGVRTRYSPQAFYYYKAFGGFAEYVHTSTPIRKGAVREEIAHDAWQVAASWVLTGETATDAGIGVRPRTNFDFGNGSYGAFQIAARYHTLTVDDRAFDLGFAAVGASRRAEAYTVGLNWYLTGNFRYTFNYERTRFDEGADDARPTENAFVFRTQVNF
jgi:phosphate-selective porin OprO/OprP